MSVIIRKRTPIYGYSKIDKEDPEERIHQRAQFLIYKALEKADSIAKRRSFNSSLRIRIRKLKIMIGRRIKKLRKSVFLCISAAKVGLNKQVSGQLKYCKTLFGKKERTSGLGAIRIPSF